MLLTIVHVGRHVVYWVQIFGMGLYKAERYTLSVLVRFLALNFILFRPSLILQQGVVRLARKLVRRRIFVYVRVNAVGSSGPIE